MRTHGSLFSGIGGFDLAAEWMGWENIFHCEWNEFGQKILKHYWPNAKSYGDITKTDFTIHRGEIDIITGGFPCQPYSQAGKRKGKADDRHLWPEMLRAIREIQPRWVVGENVSGLLNWNRGMVLDEIKTDLEAAGFEVLPPLVLPACAVNAPHRRDRVWIVAHSKNVGYCPHYKQRENNGIKERNIYECEKQRWDEIRPNVSESCQNEFTPDTNSNGCYRSNGEYEINTSERRFDALNDIEQSDVSHPKFERLERGGRQWKGFESRLKENYWRTFPTTQPTIRSRNDGLPSKLAGITFSKHRTESIKGYGNSIVPQVVFELFKAIEQIENGIK